MFAAPLIIDLKHQMQNAMIVNNKPKIIASKYILFKFECGVIWIRTRLYSFSDCCFHRD